MDQKLQAILQEMEQKIASAKSEVELQAVKVSALGKQGALTSLMKELPKFAPEQRPIIGQAVNRVKNQLSELIENKREEIKLQAAAVPADFDCTVPGFAPQCGGLHPITQMCYDLNDAFRSMGFEVFQEDDITSEMYAFDNLNFPPNHPAKAWIHTGSRDTTRVMQMKSFASVLI